MKKRYRDPEFRLVDECHAHSLRAAATALATSGARRRDADQPAHDFGRGFGRHRIHLFQRRCLGRIDAGFRLRRFAGEVALERRPLGRHFLFQLGASGLRRLSAPALGLGQRLLIGGDGLLRLAPKLVGGIEVARDARGPHLDHAADARQRHPLHQHVENAEGDRRAR